MKSIKLIFTCILLFSLYAFDDIKLPNEEYNTMNDNNEQYSGKIIKGSSIEMLNGRRPYDLEGRELSTKHFVVRVTTPDNPFKPHKHEQSELWFIISGKATLLLNGVEHEVEANDLIVLDPWVEHGLSTTSEVTWICLG